MHCRRRGRQEWRERVDRMGLVARLGPRRPRQTQIADLLRWPPGGACARGGVRGQALAGPAGLRQPPPRHPLPLRPRRRRGSAPPGGQRALAGRAGAVVRGQPRPCLLGARRGVPAQTSVSAGDRWASMRHPCAGPQPARGIVVRVSGRKIERGPPPPARRTDRVIAAAVRIVGSHSAIGARPLSPHRGARPGAVRRELVSLAVGLFNTAKSDRRPIPPGRFVPALRAQCRGLWARSSVCRSPLLSP